MKNYLVLDDDQLSRIDSMYESYKRLYDSPADCRPMFLINTPVKLPTWEERLADPLVMLRANLDSLRPHLEIGDDRVPTVRVDFGTAIVAAAFGCDLAFPENNLPAAANHVLHDISDVRRLEKPSLQAGWYGKLEEWTDVYRRNLPEGIHIQHPDIQSCFNTAHLVRGNDILTDFYDSPNELGVLLDLVTDYMIELTFHLKSMISDDTEWFFDWGAMWRGFARISNCSMHMISPEFYRDHVLPRDVRFLRAVGGGRVHYCGTSGQVIDEFFKNPEVTGLDFDGGLHDLWEISERLPESAALLMWNVPQTALVERLLNGDWPKKRNLILQLSAGSIEEGRELLSALRRSAEEAHG